MPSPLPPFRLIAAIDEANGIGWQGELPFRIRADIDYFRKQIEHSIVIGTRATLNQIGKPPPGARLWGVSRNTSQPGKYWESVWDNWQKAVSAAAKESPASHPWIVGGEWLFQQSLPRATELYLTRVHGTFPADRFFPDSWEQRFSNLVWSESHPEGQPSWTWERRNNEEDT